METNLVEEDELCDDSEPREVRSGTVNWKLGTGGKRWHMELEELAWQVCPFKAAAKEGRLEGGVGVPSAEGGNEG